MACDDPVVTVGRLAARVVVVVQQREALYQRVRVWRYTGYGAVGSQLSPKTASEGSPLPPATSPRI